MRILITTLFLAFVTTAFGQDLIIRTNGDTIKGYISEVQKDGIRYRKSDDRSQPVYTVDKVLVKKVVYESGEVEVFEATKEDKQKQEYNFNHRLSWVYTDVFIARFMVAYEYITPKGYLGIRVPICVGSTLSNFSGSGAGLTYVSGLDLNIYPTTARGPVKYFFGPQVRVGYSPNDLFENRESIFTSVTFNNGLSVNIIPELNISLYLGLGFKYSHYKDYYYYYDPQSQQYVKENYNATYPHATFGMSVGYNFGKK